MILMDREHILSQLRERIVGFAASQLSKEVAEDLTQEVMIVLHEKYGQVTRLEELVPLSFQILRFKIWETRRKSLRRAEHTQVSLDEIQIADKAGNPGIETERKELLDQLMTAIDNLGTRCRRLCPSSVRKCRRRKAQAGPAQECAPGVKAEKRTRRNHAMTVQRGGLRRIAHFSCYGADRPCYKPRRPAAASFASSVCPMRVWRNW